MDLNKIGRQAKFHQMVLRLHKSYLEGIELEVIVELTSEDSGTLALLSGFDMRLYAVWTWKRKDFAGRLGTKVC